MAQTLPSAYPGSIRATARAIAVRQPTADPRFILRHRHEHRAYRGSTPGCTGSRHRSVHSSAGKTSDHRSAKLPTASRRGRAVLALPCRSRYHTAQPLAALPQPLAQGLPVQKARPWAWCFSSAIQIGRRTGATHQLGHFCAGVRSGNRRHRHQGSHKILHFRLTNVAVRTEVCGSGPHAMAVSR